MINRNYIPNQISFYENKGLSIFDGCFKIHSL